MKCGVKLKVLQINILGATLSTGRTTREMHEYFVAHGIESFMACPTNKDCNDAFAFSSPNRIKIDYVLTMLTGKEAFFSHGATYKLLRYIKKINPDIVHIRVLHGNCIHLKKLLTFLARNDIATVVTMHDFWLMTGMCFHYTDRGCYKWETGCERCPAIKNDVRQKKFDRTPLMWNTKKKCFSSIPRLAVVGVSDWELGEIKRSFLNEASIVKRIYNWIDLDVFYPRDSSSLKSRLGLDGKTVLLGVSASWFKGDKKGFDAYLELSKHLPDSYRIVLVGEMLYEGQLPKSLISVPRIDSKKELAHYYSLADIYLNLSCEETFGKVSAEALSCGTPVVAYDATANKELVPVGGGAVVKSLAPKEIMNVIFDIVKKQKSLYIPICRKFAENNFSKDKNIKAYISIYNELLQGDK